MGLYADWVLPRFLDVMMGLEQTSAERQKCLSDVQGTVLEVGFGSGRNLPWYPTRVRKVVAVDPSVASAKLARERIAKAGFPVEYVPLEGERIDAADESFDSVVCTFSLCTIPNPGAALSQMRRVLKPGGRFFFLEHGRSADANVRRWQDRLNGVQQTMCGGCNLNRDIEGLVRAAGFAIEQLDQYYLQGAPRFVGFVTRGIAQRGAAHATAGTGVQA